jgi:hypothetical protein
VENPKPRMIRVRMEPFFRDWFFISILKRVVGLQLRA